MTRRDDFEESIRHLLGLLDRGERLETPYQQWMQDHPVIWQAIGYKRAVPHPTFHTPDRRQIVPDFVAERLDGLADVVDLKRPDMRTIVDQGGARPRASSRVAKTVTQLEDYARCLDSDDERERLEHKYEMKFPRDPRLVIIGGLGESPIALHDATAAFRSSVTLMTYETVSHAVQARYSQEFSNTDDLMYFGFDTILSVTRHPTASVESTVFEYGEETSGERLSMRVDRTGHLVLAVVDTEGSRITARSSVGLEAGRWHQVTLEVSLTNAATLLSIQIDGCTTARHQSFDVHKLSLSVLDRFTMGADVRGQQGAAFGMYLLGARLEPRDLASRGRFSNWVRTELVDGQLAAPFIDFEEHNFLRTDGIHAEGRSHDLKTPPLETDASRTFRRP